MNTAGNGAESSEKTAKDSDSIFSCQPQEKNLLNAVFRVLTKDFLQQYFKHSKSQETISDPNNSLSSSEEGFEWHVLLKKDIKLKDLLNGIDKKLKDLTNSKSQITNYNFYGSDDSLQLERKDLLFFEIRPELPSRTNLNKIMGKYRDSLRSFVENSVFKIGKIKIIVVCEKSEKTKWIESEPIKFGVVGEIKCEIIGFVEFDMKAMYQDLLQVQNIQASVLLKEVVKSKRKNEKLKELLQKNNIDLKQVGYDSDVEEPLTKKYFTHPDL